jgi:hypothetical protein
MSPLNPKGVNISVVYRQNQLNSHVFNISKDHWTAAPDKAILPKGNHQLFFVEQRATTMFVDYNFRAWERIIFHNILN